LIGQVDIAGRHRIPVQPNIVGKNCQRDAMML
jgi:hypothetical protein